jgi:hypothetical protein
MQGASRPCGTRPLATTPQFLENRLSAPVLRNFQHRLRLYSRFPAWLRNPGHVAGLEAMCGICASNFHALGLALVNGDSDGIQEDSNNRCRSLGRRQSELAHRWAGRTDIARGPSLDRETRALRQRTNSRARRARKRLGSLRLFRGVGECYALDQGQVSCPVGKRTEIFVRFSTVAGEKGSADTLRDPRGFAIKFYTEDGNYDLVGNNTPVFFIRDLLKFPDFIHSQKRDPYSNIEQPDNIWDFFSLNPEATHQFTILFSDRGIPASFRNMDGFGSHTFQWVNANGEVFWVKYHFKTDQGIQCLAAEDAVRIAGENSDYHQRDLLRAIDRAEYPSWTLKMQIMSAAEAAKYRFNPFDVTKVWPHRDYPLMTIGRIVLNHNPENYFAELEQAAFNPAHFVPGIGPSPDKMLEGRLFSYGDTHRYRLGANHMHLSVNRPHAAEARNYSRDGAMRSDVTMGARRTTSPTVSADRFRAASRFGHRLRSADLLEVTRRSIIATTMISCRPETSIG